MQGITTQGVVIQREQDGSPSTYSAIGKIESFDGPGGKSAEIDVTHLGSTAKEFMLGLQDEGSFTLNLILDTSDSQQTGLRTDKANRTLRGFKVILTDNAGTTINFQAYVMEFKLTGQKDNVIRATISLRISGPVTYA